MGCRTDFSNTSYTYKFKNYCYMANSVNINNFTHTNIQTFIMHYTMSCSF